MTPQDLRDKLAEDQAQFCNCAGFTCSGCEENTKKIFKCGWDAAWSERDAELAALKEENTELAAEVAGLKERGESWQGHAEANHALLMRADEILDAYKAQAEQLAAVLERTLNAKVHVAELRDILAGFERFRRGRGE